MLYWSVDPPFWFSVFQHISVCIKLAGCKKVLVFFFFFFFFLRKIGGICLNRKGKYCFIKYVSVCSCWGVCYVHLGHSCKGPFLRGHKNLTARLHRSSSEGIPLECPLLFRLCVTFAHEIWWFVWEQYPFLL